MGRGAGEWTQIGVVIASAAQWSPALCRRLTGEAGRELRLRLQRADAREIRAIAGHAVEELEAKRIGGAAEQSQINALNCCHGKFP